MEKNRLEAFSDGVIAIIITIMVLEMKVPHGEDFAALWPLLPVFLAYVLSYTYVGLYWNNHHHLLQATKRVNGRILWANLHLLFWLSLIPFVTGWMGENHFAHIPLVFYGIVLFMAAVSWRILQASIIAEQGPDSMLAKAVGHDTKGTIPFVLYALGIGLAFVNHWLSGACYVLVAALWFIPDRRIEKALAAAHAESGKSPSKEA